MVQRAHTRHILKHGLRPQGRSGTACVEFALVAPVIFLLFLGAIEMAQLNFLRHTAGNAAYEAARQAIVPASTGEDASQEAIRLLNAVNAGWGAEIDVQQQHDRVTVTVRIPTNLNSWGLSRFSSGFHITQSCTLMRERTGS